MVALTMERTKPVTGTECSCKFREAHRTPEDTRKVANVKKVQRAMYKRTDTKVKRHTRKPYLGPAASVIDSATNLNR